MLSSPPPPSPHKHPWRSDHSLPAFRHATDGILHTFRTQRNLRVHALVLVLVLAAGLLVRLPATEMALLLLAIALVLVAELFNTAIETVVDLVTTEYHPLAKIAKDVAAGAVLVAAGGAAAVGVLVFFGSGRLTTIGDRLREPPLFAAFVAAVLLLLTLGLAVNVAPRRGGAPRGAVSLPTALAFFLAATLIVLYSSVFAALVVSLLALLVARTRVEARLDTLQEVVLGAALAVFLSAGVYWLAPWFAGRFVPASGNGIPAASAPLPRQAAPMLPSVPQPMPEAAAPFSRP